MPSAQQTSSTFAPYTKYFGRSFTTAVKRRIERLSRSNPPSDQQVVTDGGVQATGDVDLDAKRAQPSTTPLEERDYCPECETPKVFRKTGPADRRPNPEPWRCSNGHHFQDPVAYDDLEELPKGARQ